MTTIFLNVPEHGRCALLDECHGSLLVENEGGARFWVPMDGCEIAGAEIEGGARFWVPMDGCEIAGAEIELPDDPADNIDFTTKADAADLFPAMLEKLDACAEILAADPGHQGGTFIDELRQLIAVAKAVKQ